MGPKTGTKRTIGDREGKGGGGTGGGGGNPGQDSKAVRFQRDLEQPDIVNQSRHPIVSNLMGPLERAGINWSVSKLCKAAKIQGGVASLPQFPNRKACYRFILGKCKNKCLADGVHLERGELPDATVRELCLLLAPGISSMCASGSGGLQPALKKPKRK